MLFSSQSFTKSILLLFICIYFFSFIKKTTADETSMQEISNFSIDINEVTIGDFYKFVTSTNYKTKAEKRGWGYVYEFGWVQKRGWNWKNPYGVKGEKMNQQFISILMKRNCSANGKIKDFHMKMNGL